jgi:thioredoxin reductase (NADPH)
MTQGLPDFGDLETRRAQMFPQMSATLCARVAAFGEEMSFHRGAILWEQGDTRVPFYVVLEGELEIVHPHGTSEDAVVVHDKPGEFTGEINLLTDRRSLVRARAATDIRVIRVPYERFRALVQNDPELSELVMRAFILRRMGLLSAGFGDAVVIGCKDSAATLRLQSFLTRNGHPYRYVDVQREADVQVLLDQFHVEPKDIPILICRGELVLRNPSDAEVAECLGFNAAVDPCTVRDLVICGAGPGGLAAAVYGASEGLDVVILETGAPGGQAASSSKIENYLGFPTGVSGQALTARALTQAEKFGASIQVAHGAVRLFCEEIPMRIELAGGESVRARAIVIATGAEYRKLDIADIPRFEGVGIYYAATFVESHRCSAEEVIVVGGGNSAGQAATFLARTSKHVHMLIRGPSLADSMSRYLIRRIEETANITLHRRTRVIALQGETHLEQVTWKDDATGEESTRPIRHIFSMAGAQPNSAWVDGCLAMDDKGFILTGTELTDEHLQRDGWPLERRPYLFETSRPRVFAVGDIRSGSVKRVASAVGEGSVCIQLVHKVLSE